MVFSYFSNETFLDRIIKEKPLNLQNKTHSFFFKFIFIFLKRILSMLCVLKLLPLLSLIQILRIRIFSKIFLKQLLLLKIFYPEK